MDLLQNKKSKFRFSKPGKWIAINYPLFSHLDQIKYLQFAGLRAGYEILPRFMVIVNKQRKRTALT